jgi:hypothetical protein
LPFAAAVPMLTTSGVVPLMSFAVTERTRTIATSGLPSA